MRSMKEFSQIEKKNLYKVKEKILKVLGVTVYRKERKQRCCWLALPMCVDSDFLDLTAITRTILLTVLIHQNFMLGKNLSLRKI